MQLFVDRNRLYLVCFYFSMSFFYLSFVLDEQDPLPMLGYILALIIFIVISHDGLLQVIVQATGQNQAGSEVEYFAAFIDLNQLIHNYLEVDDVLGQVEETLRRKVHFTQVHFLLAREVEGRFEAGPEADKDALTLQCWPDRRSLANHDRDFERYIEKNAVVQTRRFAVERVTRIFDETGTSVLVPVVQNDKLLCIMLLGRSGDTGDYSEFELQMFDYLASQLSIILDRVRVYAQIMQKTAMDHAEKVQVMQSLSANIAHEMRTPLSGIRASISGCEEYFDALIDTHAFAVREKPDRYPAIREDQLKRLRETPRRIHLMIDQANTVIDMLLMNLRENSLDSKLMDDIDAAAMVEQAVDRYPFKKGERELLSLDLRENFTFKGVESLCIYILFNLLKNAYYSIQSARTGDITIVLRHSGDMNVIEFTDTGLGIDESIVQRIFDGFFTTRHDGTGAGLAFCKRTVRDFGGDISCQSVLGEYARFRIVLPALSAPSAG